jgi:catechol 2,3-dioxygenase-like lactoylglutathione lyase family enzyme
MAPLPYFQRPVTILRSLPANLARDCGEHKPERSSWPIFRDKLAATSIGESLMSMSVGVLDHYNVSTRNLGATVRFYEEVLGFVNGPRPPFDFPGAWLYSEGHPVLHLNDISPTDTPQRPDSGVIDHVAFGSRGFEAMKQHLEQKGVEFRVNVVPNSTRRQIFVNDPNNVLIELNFDVAKETAS